MLLAATPSGRVSEVPKLPVEEADTEFKRKFPPDTQLGQELAENARVWKVYREEAIQHDDGVLSGWNNTIDILLTFVCSRVLVTIPPDDEVGWSVLGGHDSVHHPGIPIGANGLRPGHRAVPQRRNPRSVQQLPADLDFTHPRVFDTSCADIFRSRQSALVY